MNKPDKITRRILDPSLLGEIEGKVDKEELEKSYRKIIIPITEDDLNASLRAKVNSGGSADGYDDTELRERIKANEDNKADKNQLSEYFHKVEDKVIEDMLAQDIKDTLAKKASVDDLADKLEQAQADERYRQLAVDIAEEDLTEELARKINATANGELQVPQYIINDIEALKDTSQNQGQSILTIANNLDEYRRKNVKIGLSDIADTLSEQIQHARQDTEQIHEDDLDEAVRLKLAKADSILDNDTVNLKFLELDDKLFDGENGSLIFSSKENINKVMYDWLVKVDNYCKTEEEIAFALAHSEDYYDISTFPGYYCYKEDNVWTNTAYEYLDKDFTNRILYNPYFGSRYLCAPNLTVDNLPISLGRDKEKVKLVRTIEAKSSHAIDIKELFGVMASAEDIDVKIKILDNITDSRTEDKWINSEAVITVALERNVEAAVTAKIELYNDTEEQRTCLIILEGYRAGYIA